MRRSRAASAAAAASGVAARPRSRTHTSPSLGAIVTATSPVDSPGPSHAASRSSRSASVTPAVRSGRTAGVRLADLEERLAAWLGPGESTGEVAVTMAPSEGEVWVRLRGRAATPEAAAAALAALERRIAEALGDDCYGRDGESLEQAVGKRLAARGLTLAVAE